MRSNHRQQGRRETKEALTDLRDNGDKLIAKVVAVRNRTD